MKTRKETRNRETPYVVEINSLPLLKHDNEQIAPWNEGLESNPIILLITNRLGVSAQPINASLRHAY